MGDTRTKTEIIKRLNEVVLEKKELIEILPNPERYGVEVSFAGEIGKFNYAIELLNWILKDK